MPVGPPFACYAFSRLFPPNPKYRPSFLSHLYYLSFVVDIPIMLREGFGTWCMGSSPSPPIFLWEPLTSDSTMSAVTPFFLQIDLCRHRRY